MLDPANVPKVDAHETLSRYVLTKRHVNQHGLLKADAFYPHPHTELSVTRDREATDDEIWEVGRDVAMARNKPLVGRGDTLAASYRNLKLSVEPDPIAGNPNHVNVCGWPSGDKPRQKLIAQEIAELATYRPA